MKDDDRTERAEKKDDKPKRLVLNKRIIKHLVVKSNVRTGLSAYCDTGSTEDGCVMTRCCTNHNTTKIRNRRG